LQLQYKEQYHKTTPMSVTPEMERVRRNQEQLSTASGSVFSFIGKRYAFLFFTVLSEKLKPSVGWMLLFTVMCSRACPLILSFDPGNVGLSCYNLAMVVYSRNLQQAPQSTRHSTGTQRWVGAGSYPHGPHS